MVYERFGFCLDNDIVSYSLPLVWFWYIAGIVIAATLVTC